MRGDTEKHEEGQATVEFALTLILLMAFTLFFLQLSLVFAVGNYVHYATFMAARAYLSSGSSDTDQVTRAENVIRAMLKKSAGNSTDRFPSIAIGTGGDTVGGINGLLVGPGAQWAPPTRDSSWMQGVRYTFRSRLFMIPLGGTPSTNGSSSSSVNSVTLTSESWLGHEPSYQDCQAYMGSVKGIFDNGC